MKKFQITEWADWFNQKEVFHIIRNLKINEKVEIIRLKEKN